MPPLHCIKAKVPLPHLMTSKQIAWFSLYRSVSCTVALKLQGTCQSGAGPLLITKSSVSCTILLFGTRVQNMSVSFPLSHSLLFFKQNCEQKNPGSLLVALQEFRVLSRHEGLVLKKLLVNLCPPPSYLQPTPTSELPHLTLHLETFSGRFLPLLFLQLLSWIYFSSCFLGSVSFYSATCSPFEEMFTKLPKGP